MSEQTIIDLLTKKLSSKYGSGLEVAAILADHAHTMRVAYTILETKSLELDVLVDRIDQHFDGNLPVECIAPIVIDKTFQLIRSSLIDTYGNFMNADFKNAVVQYGRTFEHD